MDWISIEDRIPPPHTWIYTTRRLGDPEYEGGPRTFYDIDIFIYFLLWFVIGLAIGWYLGVKYIVPWLDRKGW
jgi:hypothetical protein